MSEDVVNWDKVTVVGEVLNLVVFLWLFAASYEPLCSRAFGRPLSRRQVIVMRVMAAIGIVGGLALLLGDIILR